ncbi:MAG TPA: uracil-DNA glycosylase [Acetobacteraceae bacterium]|nr:uracil-DNA glycosylase [Acetobacteraceae bacterium]
MIRAPGRDCPLCPRLVAFRMESRAAHPDWHNAPVPGFGAESARLLIVGLAPGLRGANRTGRPFTGDYAGHLLYETLLRFGFAAGEYRERPDDGLTLKDCRIVNAVRCVPPENLPKPVEIRTCNQFLIPEFEGMRQPKAVLALGVVAHQAVLRALGLKQSFAKFRHGAVHELPNGAILADSFHVSRYNTNTGRLTTEMFCDVVARIRQRLDQL